MFGNYPQVQQGRKKKGDKDCGVSEEEQQRIAEERFEQVD